MSMTMKNSTANRSRRQSKQVVVQLAVAAGAAAVALLCLLLVSAEALELGSTHLQQEKHQPQQHDKESSAGASRKSSLEAELDSIVQQHDNSFDRSDRSLAEAIISRLMLDNILTNELASPAPTPATGAAQLETEDNLYGADTSEMEQPPYYSAAGRSSFGAAPAEALKLKKLLSMVQAYESSVQNGYGPSAAAGLPVLPASQAATSKRATRLAGNYLQQHQAYAGANSGALNAGNLAYGGRGSFDFGLGKRPDTAGASSNILRLSDSLSGGSSGIQGVNQFGKRPSAHRYDFGLGKRKASSAYPRYDFGLGKRAPNGIRYDFGLGK